MEDMKKESESANWWRYSPRESANAIDWRGAIVI